MAQNGCAPNIFVTPVAAKTNKTMATAIPMPALHLRFFNIHPLPWFTRRVCGLSAVQANHACSPNCAQKKNGAETAPFTNNLNALSAGLRSFGDEFHRVAECLDSFGSIIRNFNSEFFFEGHNQLDSVKAVSAQIVNEGRAFGHFVFVDAQVLDNNLFNAICDVAHFASSLVFRALALFQVTRWAV
jgi:hypothetical protein